MRRITSILISIVFSLSLKAQIPQPPTNMLSPNTAGLGLYGQIPVSLFTGIPEISIPLYNLPNKNIDLPISLSYYAGGVRADQHPGWVGTNWTLMIGGSISRIVKGLPDETHQPDKQLSNAGYYFNHSTLDIPNWSTDSFMQSIPVICDFYAPDKSHYTKDYEPDEFSFNFNGYSGKFYFSSENDPNNLPKIVVNCSKTVKITLNQNIFLDGLANAIPAAYNKYYYPATHINEIQNKPFSGFTIITEQGVKYVFGGDFSSIDFSTDFFNAKQWTACSWHLTKIIQPNGSETIFSYKRAKDVSGKFKFINQLFHYDHIESSSIYYDAEFCNIDIYRSSDPLEFVEDLFITINTFITQIFGMCTSNIGCSTFSFHSTGSNFGGSLIFPAYLESITAANYKVNFTTSQSVELRTDPDGAGSYNPYADPQSSYYNLNSPNRNPYLKYWNINGFCPYLSSEYLFQQHLLQLQWQKLDTIKIFNSDNHLIKSFSFNYNNSEKERLFLLSLTENTIDEKPMKKYSFEYNERELLPPYLSNATDHWGFFNNKNPNNLDNIDYYSFRETDSSAIKYGIIKKIKYPTGGTTEFEFEANKYSKKLKPLRWEGYNELDTDTIAGGLRIKKITNNSNDGALPVIKEYFYVNNFCPTNSQGRSSGILGGNIQYYFYYLVNGSDNLKYIENIFSSQSVLPMCNNSLGSHVGYSEVVEKLSDGSYTRYKFTNFDYSLRNSLDEKFENTSDISLTSYQPYNSNEQLRGLLYNKEIRDASDNIKYMEEYNYVNSDTLQNQAYVKGVKSSIRETPCYVSPGSPAEFIVFFKETTAYKIYTYSMLPQIIQTHTYNNDGNDVWESKDFMYNSENQIVAESMDNGSSSIQKLTYYPQDIVSQYPMMNWPTSLLAAMTVEASGLVNDFCLLPVADETINNGVYTKGNYYEYWQPKIGCHVLKNVYTSSKENVFQKIVEYPNYDSKANPLSIIEKGSLNTVYLWGYKHQYPIAEIKNATYIQVVTALSTLGTNPETIAANTTPDMLKINSLRAALPSAHITTFTYKPLIGITSKTDPRGVTTTYVYDTFNRLREIKDSNGKLVEKLDYKYKD